MIRWPWATPHRVARIFGLTLLVLAALWPGWAAAQFRVRLRDGDFGAFRQGHGVSRRYGNHFGISRQVDGITACIVHSSPLFERFTTTWDRR